MKVLQLKPKESSFYKMAKNVTGRKLRTIFICEGKRDTEALKGLIGKFFDTQTGLAVTDCEGKDTISEIALDIATLASVSRTLNSIAIVIDADECSPEGRAQSILNSLRAKVDNIEMVEINGLFEIQSQFRVKIFVKVVGDFSLPYNKHTIEDHILQLLLLEGLIEEDAIRNYSTAKECVNDFVESCNVTVKELILNAQKENVQKAFGDLVEHLRVVDVSQDFAQL